jgi:hypothetical protein
MLVQKSTGRKKANPRSALDARIALCFHIEPHWPGAQ